MNLPATTSGNTALATPPSRTISSDLFNDPIAFEHGQRVAKLFASSKLIPAHFRNNVADCLIALQIARRLNEDPLTVFQALYIVNGRPGWQTSYMIARANNCGTFRGPITWKSSGSGESLTVTARATVASTGEVVEVSADMHMAKAEGWTRNDKYKSMPEHMLRYRSAAMLIRLFAPEIMTGLPVIEEIETMPPLSQREAQAAWQNKSLDSFIEGLKSTETVDPETGEIIETGAVPPSVPQAATEDATNPEASTHNAAEYGAGDEDSRQPSPALLASKPEKLNPISVARERGYRAYEHKYSSKAIPPEYRPIGREEEAKAWVEGWKMGEAADKK